MKRIVVKSFKIFGITTGLILLLMFLLPILFPGKIELEIKKFANQKLKGELAFKEANLSFFNHFPSLTLSLEEFSLKGSEPFKKDTLLIMHLFYNLLYWIYNFIFRHFNCFELFCIACIHK